MCRQSGLLARVLRYGIYIALASDSVLFGLVPASFRQYSTIIMWSFKKSVYFSGPISSWLCIFFTNTPPQVAS